MTVDGISDEGVTLRMSLDELVTINNALSASCSAVRVSEADFPTLIGVTRQEGKALLREINEAVDQLRAQVEEQPPVPPVRPHELPRAFRRPPFL